MAEKQQKELKPGEPLKQSTVTVLSVSLGLCAFFLFIGLVWVPASAGLFCTLGAIIGVFGIVCTLPNLIGFFRGKKIERLIRQGKYNPPKKKDFNPNHRWGD